MSGYYRMYRGWQAHPVFGSEPFSRRDAWLWLIENAAYKARRVGYGPRAIELQRGQLCHSLRHLAAQWGWDDPKVRRFIARIESEGMIQCVVVNGMTVLTVCNYEQYQTLGCVDDAEPDAGTTQERRSGDANKKEGNEGNESLSVASAPEREPVAERFVSIWHEELGEHLPSPSRLNVNRRRLCALRFADEFGRDFERWRAYCQSIRGSPFCLGENDRGWRADFDWALKPASILKVQEGKYRGGSRPKPQFGEAKDDQRDRRRSALVAAALALDVDPGVPGAGVDGGGANGACGGGEILDPGRPEDGRRVA